MIPAVEGLVKNNTRDPNMSKHGMHNQLNSYILIGETTIYFALPKVMGTYYASLKVILRTFFASQGPKMTTSYASQKLVMTIF